MLLLESDMATLADELPQRDEHSDGVCLVSDYRGFTRRYSTR